MSLYSGILQKLQNSCINILLGAREMDPEVQSSLSESKIIPAEPGRSRKPKRDVQQWKKTKEKIRRYN